METEDKTTDELINLGQSYFSAYFGNEHASLYLRIQAIKEHFDNQPDEDRRISDFSLYLHLLMENEKFISCFTHSNNDSKANRSKISEIISHLQLKTNTIQVSNLLYFNPEQLVLFILYSPVADIFQLKLPININPVPFTYTIRKAQNQPVVYFLYDLTKHVEYCEYTGMIMPVNNKKYRGVYDYHLPIYKLFERYTDHSICLTNDRNGIKENKYIYVHTIDHIYNFFREHGSDFHKTIPDQIYEDVNAGKAIYILNSAQEGVSISDFYYKIQKGIRQYFTGKYAENIFLLSGNYYEKKSVDRFNQQKMIPSADLISILKNYSASFATKQKLNSHPFRYFEECIAMQYKRHYQGYAYEVKLQHLEKKAFKTYLCFNGHKKIFRYAFCYLLWKNKLLENGNVSLRKIDSLDECSDLQQKKLISKILLSDEPAFLEFKKQLPLLADKKNLHLNYWYQVSLELVNHTFLWIITETTFGGQFYNFSFSFFTEKTYKPIALFMPFIMVGDRHSLKVLKEEGYQTFSKWWCEDYDNILDKVQRMKAIIRLLTEINSKGKEELLTIYKEMEPVLKHNFNNLMERNAGSRMIKKIAKLYTEL